MQFYHHYLYIFFILFCFKNGSYCYFLFYSPGVFLPSLVSLFFFENKQDTLSLKLRTWSHLQRHRNYTLTNCVTLRPCAAALPPRPPPSPPP